MIKPYYETTRGKLYNCDCLDILPEIEQVDLVLTEPPYGVGMDKGCGTGVCKTSIKKYTDNWDSKRPDKEVFNFITKNNCIIFGGQFFCDLLEPNDKWIVWDKKDDISFTNFYSDCEMAYTNLKGKTIKYTVIQQGFIAKEKERFHPTQKPVILFNMILQDHSKENDLILDPFLGSGTTAVACEDLNRRWIGIEKEEKYCELASKRIEQFNAQGKLF